MQEHERRASEAAGLMCRPNDPPGRTLRLETPGALTTRSADTVVGRFSNYRIPNPVSTE